MISLLLGVVLAGAGLGHGAAATTQPTSGPTTGPAYSVPADRPWWEREGLVIASVNEVLADRAWRISGGRTREPATQERAAYAEERSEPVLAKLREMGITLVLVPYGGYGPDKIEEGERRIARETIARCHKIGLKCGVWLPVGQLDPSVWKAEQPDVQQWLLRSANGQAIASQGGRYFTSLGVQAVIARMAALLSESVGLWNADAVFLPNWRFSIGHEKSSKGVHATIRANRATKSNPFLQGGSPPTEAESPQCRDWLEARASVLESALTELMLQLPVRPATQWVLRGIDCNGASRQIAPIEGPAVDPPSLLRNVDVVMVPAVPRVDDRQRVTHQIVEIKTTTAVGCRTAMTQGTKLAMAQQLAFGGDCGGVLTYFTDAKLSADDIGSIGVFSEVVKLALAYRRERAFYAGLRPVADVVVYQPKQARLFGGPAADVGQIQACNALVTHRIPFSFNFDDRPRDIPRDAAIMIAGIPNVTEDQASELRAHVAAGGGLIVIGETAVQDSTGKTVARDLAEYLTVQSSGPAPTTSPPGRSEIVIRRLESGRIVSLARPGPALNLWLTTRKDRKAKVAGTIESDDFSEAVRAALGRPLSVEGAFERGSAIELSRAADGNRTTLHVVNFTADTPLSATAVQVRVPNAVAVRHVWRFPALGAGGCTEVKFRAKEGAVAFETDSNALYDAYLIE